MFTHVVSVVGSCEFRVCWREFELCVTLVSGVFVSVFVFVVCVRV